MLYLQGCSEISSSTLALLEKTQIPLWLVNLATRKVIWANASAWQWWGVDTLEAITIEEKLFLSRDFVQIEARDSFSLEWIFHLPGQTLNREGIALKISLKKEEHFILGIGKELIVNSDVHKPQKALKLDQLITHLLTDFISLDLDKNDLKINEALGLVGEFAEVDRSYIFLFNDSQKTKFSCTHEWCNQGILPQIDNLKNLSISDFYNFIYKLENLDTVVIENVEKLENFSSLEKSSLQAQEIQFLIMVPLILRSYQDELLSHSLLGFIGFEAVRQEKCWSDNSIYLLNIFAEILANALYRQHSENSIREHQDHTIQLLNSLPGIVFQAFNHNDFTMEFLSEGCYKITGYTPEELILNQDKNYHDIIHPEDKYQTLNIIKESLIEKHYYEVEYRIFTKNGQEKWLWEQGKIKSISKNKNKEQKIEGFITDITSFKVTEQALVESENRYRLLAENSTDLISRHSVDGKCLYASSACESLLGYKGQNLPENFIFELCHPEDLEIIKQFHEHIIAKADLEPIAYRIHHHNGTYIWLETTAKIISDPISGKVEEFIAISRNINQRKQTEASLRQAEEQYRDIFENISQGIFQTTAEGRYLKANPALARIYGYDSTEELIKHLTNIEYQLYVDPNRRIQLMQMIEQLGGSITSVESQVYRKDGSIIWIVETTRTVYDSQGNFLYYEGNVEDITYKKSTEAQLLHDAFYDALTGLHNRAWFTNELQRVIESNKYAVLFIDLDGFKVINDSFGHLIGDELLQKVARRLKMELRNRDKIARFGGDEFVIMIENIEEMADVIRIAQRLQESLKIPFQLSQETVFISASIGITTSAIDYQKTEEILRDADIAMYRAKANGKACYAVFSPEMQKAILVRLQTENDLRQALENQEFHLYYQPIISLVTGNLTGFEALLRWIHPTKGMISPGEFIPIAEETGLIHPIGWWVLQQACYQLQQWRAIYPWANSLAINVNLSAHQLKEAGLVQHIDHLLQKTDLKGHQLKLEITESAFLETIASKASVVQQLKSFGLQLCIDDFGTGYSSLSRLHEFPIDTLKIDRSFINRLDLEQTAIVQTIITLAHTLGMNVVAEGIETCSQLEKLQKLACEFGQGYLISPPVPAEVASKFLRQPILLNSAVQIAR
jgi:diguanylate cyclase (GGDEF)-like protein/PAS domain S-box-containing protein